MELVEVFIEHSTLALSRPFTYSAPRPVQPGCRVFVPFGSQKLAGLVIGPGKMPEDPSIRIRSIIRILDEEPVLNEEQIALAHFLARQTVSSFMAVVHCMLPGALDARAVRPGLASEILVSKNSSICAGDLTSKQQQALQVLESEQTLAAARSLVGDYMVRTLEKKGALSRSRRTVNHGTLARRPQKPWPQLSPVQINALQTIERSEQQTVLLHGVTGSGKTEIFFHLARKALEEKKQVLILVPEISLTPMMEERIASRFDADVYCCHSRLSESQMVSVWNNLKTAGPCIVLGTRKSVFLPFSNLGLIILDEEHDPSYKQDSTPRYHARDAAEFRAARHHCRLILASATPSLESYARALRHVYGLAELPLRAAGQDARIRLIDLRRSRTFCNYSSELIQALQKRLDLHEKTLILLNRRGYLPVIRCQSCHEYLRCEECGIPLSYHKAQDALICHVCGKQTPMPSCCPQCGSSNLLRSGQGTERLEEESRALFPAARIVRMDYDTTRRKGAHQALLEEFETGGDILMGTQMIAKGLDYHEITLCGILSVDSILNRPDYTASERAYQLTEQAAGRAGRGKNEGEVLIQTFNPDHFVLQCVASHRYRDFFVREMRFRHLGNYPPYVFLAAAVVRHDDPVQAFSKAEKLRGFLEESGLEVLGPIEISMRSRQSRFRLVVRSKDDGHLIETLWQAALWFEKNPGGCRLDLNVHPMNLEE